ncbi:hypothetical protein Q0V21_19610 [Paenibacillus sp. 11B]|uniref:hypothetical protein n=1 Tax=unclassified Paenibacillus TaxID=185978 RepID=UPI00264C3B5A|nr:hypothetical protein [Paenibacillus sp. 11B]MDN8590970.1 hypothetical protein [Paenibacillus sp. 11B]
MKTASKLRIVSESVLGENGEKLTVSPEVLPSLTNNCKLAITSLATGQEFKLIQGTA